MTDEQRLELVKSMCKQHLTFAPDEIRPFYSASSTRKDNDPLYYVVPVKTETMGRNNAHVDGKTGQVIAFKGVHHNLHIDRVKKRLLDPGIVSIVDKWLTVMEKK